MPGTLTHPPARIIQQLLVDLGHTFAAGAGVDWESFVSLEPEDPDKCVTVYDTGITDDGREHINGERVAHEDIQVRVRSSDYEAGHVKANAIALAFDSSVQKTIVSISSTSYTVWAITRILGPLSLGLAPESKRNIFTISAKATIRQRS